jgi:hypothetical protein
MPLLFQTMLFLSCQESEETEKSYPEIELYDFDAAEPWYQTEGLSYPSGTTVVTGFDLTDQYFGSEDKRTIRADVEFPEEGDWVQIGMYFRLDCPESGRCDHWDRTGSVHLIQNEDTESEEKIEILRHITPYRIGMAQYVDVTALAPILKGTQTLTSFIDTWVGPGHAQGEGWRVTVRFVFYPGPPAGPSEVYNVWGKRNITVGQVEEGSTIADQVDPASFFVPSDVTRVVAHLTTTGHSFGNTYNCAEFCEMKHDLSINGNIHSTEPWRGDCDVNPVSPQFGTWEYGRNGWCPGAVTVGDQIDITDSILIGEENSLDFDILLANGSVYDNTDPVDLLPTTATSLKLYFYK